MQLFFSVGQDWNYYKYTGLDVAEMYRQSHVPLVSFFNIMQVQNCCESYVILVLPLFTCITVLFRTTDNCVFLVGDNPSYICLLKQTYFLLLLNILKIGLQLTGIKIDATSCLMCGIDASCWYILVVPKWPKTSYIF